MIVNTIIADAISKLSDQIEAEFTKLSSEDPKARKAVVLQIIKNTLRQHYRVVFNGNGYSQEWVELAAKRGLLNLKNTPEALKLLTDQKNIDLFEKFQILSKPEVVSRQMIAYEEYAKQVVMEANVLLNMSRTIVLPAIVKSQRDFAQSVHAVKTVSDKIEVGEQEVTLTEITKLTNSLLLLSKNLANLIKEDTHNEHGGEGGYKTQLERGQFVCSKIIPGMENLREVCDKIEELVDDEYWNLPKYYEILHLK